MSQQEDIEARLSELDTTGCTQCTIKDGRASVHYEGYEDDPVEVDADTLAEVLGRLPDGCPTAEGEDGSLWETLFAIREGGRKAALDYIEEHHGAGVA